MRRLKTIAIAAVLALAACSTSYGQSVEFRGGAWIVTPPSPATINVDSAGGYVLIRWGPGPAPPIPPPGPSPTPTPTPTPVPPSPTPTPTPTPDPARKAAWLLLFWGDSPTAAHADIRNSATLDPAVAPVKVHDLAFGTPEYNRLSAPLATYNIPLPAYVVADAGGNVLTYGTIASEAQLIDAVKGAK